MQRPRFKDPQEKVLFMPAFWRWWKRQRARLKLHISVEHTFSHQFVDFDVAFLFGERVQGFCGILGRGGYFKIVLKNSRDRRMCPHLTWPLLCSSLWRQQKPRLPSMWRKLLVEIFTNPFRVSRLLQFCRFGWIRFLFGVKVYVGCGWGDNWKLLWRISGFPKICLHLTSFFPPNCHRW